MTASGNVSYAQAPTSYAGSDLDQKISALENLVLEDEQKQQAGATPATDATAVTPPATTNAAPAMPTITFAQMGPAVRYVRSLRQDVARQSYTNAISAANNAAGADNSPAVQKAVADLLPLLQKAKDEQEASSKQELQGVQGLIDRATKVILSAKDPKELDPLVVEIGQAIAQNRSGVYAPDRQATSTLLQEVSRFVKEWQSYLSDQASGNAMQAANDLRSLANMSDTYMPIPRSELLARAAKASGTEPAAIDMQVEVKSFDDIPAAISKLQMLQRSGNYNMEMNTLMSSLQSLQNAYLAYQDKNYSGALQAMQGYPMMIDSMINPTTAGEKPPAHDSLRREIIELKDTLLVEIAQGLLAMPDAPAPQKDESGPNYVLRIAELKKKAADWTGLQQVLMVYQQVAGMYNPQPWLQEDLSGIHAYLIGEKLEAAGQYLDAIRSYRQALATLGKFFPADPAAAKLKELEKAYPDAYKEALQQPIGPKMP